MTRKCLRNPIRTVKQQAHARTLNQTELHQELRRADAIINHAWHTMGINSQIQLVHDLSTDNVTRPTDPLAEYPRNLALNRTMPYISPMTGILQLIVLFLIVAVITLSISNTITTTENKYLKIKLAQTATISLTKTTRNTTMTNEKEKTKKDNATVRAFKIVKVLAGKSLQGMQLKDIATAMKDNNVNCLRSLQDMEKAGFVVQFEHNKQYALSTECIAIAQAHSLEINQAKHRLDEIEHDTLARANQYL